MKWHVLLCGYLIDFIHAIAGEIEDEFAGLDRSGHVAAVDDWEVSNWWASPETPPQTYHTPQHRKSFEASAMKFYPLWQNKEGEKNNTVPFWALCFSLSRWCQSCFFTGWEVSRIQSDKTETVSLRLGTTSAASRASKPSRRTIEIRLERQNWCWKQSLLHLFLRWTDEQQHKAQLNLLSCFNYSSLTSLMCQTLNRNL